MGPMTIGGQDFQLDFDTGSVGRLDILHLPRPKLTSSCPHVYSSSDLWVPGSGCSKDGCQGHKKYSKSSTGVRRSGSFSITYGDGSKTSGPVYTEGVSLAYSAAAYMTCEHS